MLILICGIGLLIVSLILFAIRQSHRRSAALPANTHIIAADHAEEPCPILISLRYGLKGKPDAILRKANGAIIPLERKYSRPPCSPYPADVIQAAAYALLIEEHFGVAPTYMRIQYRDIWFDVQFSEAHRNAVVAAGERLRAARRTQSSNRSHQMPAKCRACSHRLNCDQAL